MSLMEIGFALLVLAKYAGDPDAEDCANNVGGC